MGAKSDQEYTFGMRNILFIVVVLLYSQLSYCEDQPVRALMRIHGSNLRTSESQTVPTMVGNEEVKRVMNLLKDGDDVMIEGRIHQETVSSEGTIKINSYLIIDKLHHVSLAEIGNIKFQVPDAPVSVTKTNYSPSSIPVTAEVASAMTMTTGLLLMENLSSGVDADPQGRREIRQSIMLSAGLMATIIFIYEQLNGSAKP